MAKKQDTQEKQRYEDVLKDNVTNQQIPSYQEHKVVEASEPAMVTVSKEDLAKITKLQNGYNEVTVSFGSLKVEKIQIQTAWKDALKRETELTTLYLELQENERNIAADFAAKYGQGKLDIDTGKFIQSKKF